MSTISSVFKTDQKTEKEGVIVNFGPFSVTILRASRTNKPYRKLFEKESAPYRVAMQNDALDDEISDKILYKVYAHTIVKDWDGVKDEDGNELPYSPEACIEEFYANPSFFDAVKAEAENFAHFKASSEEADLKN